MPEDELEWASASADGRAVLQQRRRATEGLCELSCAVEAREAWRESASCLARRREPRFVANDCGRVVVIFPVALRGERWTSQVVASVFDHTKKAWDVAAVTVVKDPKRAFISPTWLMGMSGVPGEPPRYARDGSAVELDTVDGQHQRIPLITRDGG